MPCDSIIVSCKCHPDTAEPVRTWWRDACPVHGTAGAKIAAEEFERYQRDEREGIEDTKEID